MLLGSIWDSATSLCMDCILFLYILCTWCCYFSCITMPSLTCAQRFFSKMKLVNTLLHPQLKHTNPENPFYISTVQMKVLMICGWIKTLWFGYVNELATTNSSVPVLVFSIFGCYVTC